MTAQDRRRKVVEAYNELLGRNKYSQALRAYCYQKYKDGKYYSDCSSSVSYAYRKAGEDFGILNTVGMYNSKKFTKVPVIIQNGVIQNPDILRVGDMLLFAGSDSSRASSGYVGHVEMVHTISSSGVTICGHGSGTPRKTGMDAYCKSRYSKKTSTKLGHRGLIKVVRYIQDDADDGGNTDTTVIRPTRRKGDTGADVREMQMRLIGLGYVLPRYGADGDFGAETMAAIKRLQADRGLAVDGVCGPDTWRALLAEGSRSVQITGGDCWVRSGPGTGNAQLGVVRAGSVLPYGGKTASNGWLAVTYEGQTGWVSNKFGRLE